MPMNKYKLALLATLCISRAALSQPLGEIPRAADGHPDFSGTWQSLNTAHWNLEPHAAGMLAALAEQQEAAAKYVTTLATLSRVIIDGVAAVTEGGDAHG